MSDDSLLVRDLGEHGLLERLQRFCPADIVGDDGAILVTSPDKSLVVTTDVLVDGVHFSDRTTKAFDVGWRAAASPYRSAQRCGEQPERYTGVYRALREPDESLRLTNGKDTTAARQRKWRRGVIASSLQDSG